MQATPKAAVVVGPQGKAPTVTVFTDEGSQVLQIPSNHDEMRALLIRRGQISDQLTSETDRRNDLIERLRVAPAEAKPGLQAQLQVLDARIIELEKGLGTVGREIAGSSPRLISMAEQPTRPRGHDDFQAGMAVMGVPVFIVMSGIYFFSRRRWKKQMRTQPALPAVDPERMQRLEHAIDAMALEIERISEGQRFVTRLLSQTHAESTIGR